MAMSLAERIAMLPPEDRMEALKGMDPEALLWDWDFIGRPEQIPPKDDSWNVALFLAGRGAGKTRSAAEWVREKAKISNQGELRFLLVARTAADVREVLVEGEALALDTLVPSPQAPGSFTTMGKLKRGDIIIGGDGNPCKVKSGFKTLYDRPTFAVHIAGLDDPIIADMNHKWLVRRRVGASPTNRFRPDFEVKTTQEIFEDDPSQYYIERTVVKGSDQLDPPYNPYLYGKMMATRPTIKGYTNLNAEHRTMLDTYLWTSEETREKLLLGLLDGRRGSTKVNGSQKSVPITNTPRMQAQIAQIASSLGYQVREGVRYVTRKRIKTPEATYALITTRWGNKKPKYHHIEAIIPVPSVPVRCISVDSPDNTFLVTDRFIKTHNSGIMSVSPPSEKPHYQPSIRRLTWPNGNVAFCTSADEPDSLRGVQAHYSWGDEVAAWRQSPDGAGMTAWDNLRVATRLGNAPQIMATTTPKRVPLLYKLLKEADERGSVWVTRGSTFDNVGNLAGAYLDNIMGLYDGTPLAAQELFGEMLDANDGALWSDQMLRNAWEDDELPRYTPLRMVGVDPSVADSPGDECGIVVVGASGEPKMHDRHAWILEDASMKGPPSEWSQVVVAMARKWSAPIVIEKNQGHQLLLDTIHAIDPNIPVLGVNSQVGKKLRAEPIQLLYYQGRVHHPGGEKGKYEVLESQMLTWIPEISRKSPDRVDALVHALTALLISTPKGFHTGDVHAKSFADRKIQLPSANPMGTGQTRIRAPKHNSGQIYGQGRYSSGTLRLGGTPKRKPQ